MANSFGWVDPWLEQHWRQRADKQNSPPELRGDSSAAQLNDERFTDALSPGKMKEKDFGAYSKPT
jgi:hypothetical protein